MFTASMMTARLGRTLGRSRPANEIHISGYFELVVSLKTAKALGLSLRESFLLLADEVIE
jgi:hypothetical protein